MNSQQSRYHWLVIAALIATMVVCAVSWPGFMSFDSMYALKQAREGIQTGGYPPMVSYVWFLCDHLIRGQGGMFLLQNLLIFFGIVYLGRALEASTWKILMAMALTVIAPVTLGPMLVVWKDVAFAGWMLFAYAFTIEFLRTGKRPQAMKALLFITMASCFRLNGIAAALPAMALIACRFAGMKMPMQENEKFRWAFSSQGFVKVGKAATGFVGLVAIVFGFVVISSTWRLPDLKKVSMATGSGWTQMSDLIGISVCAERNLIPKSFYKGNMPIERLRNIYFPEHSQRAFGAYPLLDETGFINNQAVIDATVNQARKRYWNCYLQHRFEVFRYSIGANSGDVFYLTDAGVFPGVAGTQVRETELTHFATGYLQKMADSPIARAFVWIALACVFWLIAFFAGQRRAAIHCFLPLAGCFSYLAGSFFILPAADARYNFIVNVAAILCLCALWPQRRSAATDTSFK